MQELSTDLISKMITAVIESYQHNWLALSIAILTAAIMKVHVNPDKLRELLLRKTKVSIFGSVAFGTFTPFCACGTSAVLLGMLTTTLPWGPIMAFLTSSSLMSPDGFIMNAGIIGLQFAIALTIASIVIGLGSGFLAHLIEAKTDFLKNQTRFSARAQDQTCDCSTPTPTPIQKCGYSTPTPTPTPTPVLVQTCGCSNLQAAQETCCSNSQTITTKSRGTKILIFLKKIKLREITDVVINLGLKQILLYFSIFIAIGYLINRFVPATFFVSLFGTHTIYGVPLAALIGLPLYVTTESSLPLIKTFMSAGASGGSMLAFMITGPGTSAMVIAGLTTFMKSRVITLYILFILFGGIFCGYLYDLFLMMGILK